MSKHIGGDPGTSPARESRSGWRETDPNRQIDSTGVPRVGAGRPHPGTFGAFPGMVAPRRVQGRRNVVVTGQTPWPEGV